MGKYLSFRGRCGRRNFAFTWLILEFILCILSVVCGFVLGYHGINIIKSICLGVLGIFAFFVNWAMLANFIKRLHDFNYSGWLCLLPVMVLSLVMLTTIFNIFISWRTLIKDCCTIINILFVIVLFVIPGSKCENNYGPVPK